MFILYKPTESYRRTTLPTGRTLLYTEDGAPLHSFRRVMVMLPESPGVSIVVGPYDKWRNPSDIDGIDNAGALPADIADGRYYQWPEPSSSGEVLKLHLTPSNWLAAMSREGIAHVALIVEYHALATEVLR